MFTLLALIVPPARGALLPLLLAGSACIGGVQRAGCVLDDDCGAGFACLAGACTAGAHVDGGIGWCPALQPSLSDIDQHLFKVSCGTKTSIFYCHNSDAASGPNASSGLDLSGDPWPVLVNVAAGNLAARADAGVPLLRVKAGDPEHSFLAIKLRLQTDNDPAYGNGMPPDHPGSLCQSAQDAVAQWIAQGAPRN
jgi:hypothetical protein